MVADAASACPALLFVLSTTSAPNPSQVYHKTQRAMPNWVVSRAATNLALRAFKRVKSRIALPAKEDE